MQEVLDITGDRYGYLTVMRQVEKPADYNGKAYNRCSWWECRCKCGKVVIVAKDYLRNTDNPHCGCRAKEIRERRSKIGHDGTCMRIVTGEDGTRTIRDREGQLHGTLRNDKICPECGKVFDCYAGANWAWRTHGIRTKYYCSYGCMRKAEAGIEKPKLKYEY